MTRTKVAATDQAVVDITYVAFSVAFGGKADMGWSSAYVCF